MHVYAHATLQNETVKLIGFSSGDKICALHPCFHGPKGAPNFFIQHMCTSIKKLVQDGSALV